MFFKNRDKKLQKEIQEKINEQCRKVFDDIEAERIEHEKQLEKQKKEYEIKEKEEKERLEKEKAEMKKEYEKQKKEFLKKFCPITKENCREDCVFYIPNGINFNHAQMYYPMYHPIDESESIEGYHAHWSSTGPCCGYQKL